MLITEKIALSLESGNTKATSDLCVQALRENFPPEVVLRKGIVDGMAEAERRYAKNEILDSEVLLADQAMRAGLEVLMPYFEAAQNSASCLVVTGTLEGDIRDTDKIIASALMKSLGLEVIDLGNSISCARFVETAAMEKAKLIFCSTRMTVFLPQMKALVKAAGEANIRRQTKILLTGRPVTEWFCKNIEADFYAPNITAAADMAAEYCRKSR